ncbi:hypothetical protein PT2222_80255 [Paraburkholderia tropica]
MCCRISSSRSIRPNRTARARAWGWRSAAAWPTRWAARSSASRCRGSRPPSRCNCPSRVPRRTARCTSRRGSPAARRGRTTRAERIRQFLPDDRLPRFQTACRRVAAFLARRTKHRTRSIRAGRQNELVFLDALDDPRRETANPLVGAGKENLLVAERNGPSVHAKAEHEIGRALAHLEGVHVAVDALKRKRLLHIFLMRALRHEDAARREQIVMDAFVEPALAANALPLEIAGEIRVHESIRVLEINIDDVMESLARLSLHDFVGKSVGATGEHCGDRFTGIHAIDSRSEGPLAAAAHVFDV